MRNDPGKQELDAASMSAFIEPLDLPRLEAELPPCPDWPDLN